MTVVGGIHALAANARAFASCFAAVVPLPEAKPRKLVSRSRLVAVADTAPPAEELPPDDPAYCDDKEYRPARLVYRGVVRKVFFFDAAGTGHYFDWISNPRGVLIGDHYLLMRFPSALVLLEGTDLDCLTIHIEMGHIAELRAWRPIWPRPSGSQDGLRRAFIRAISIIEQKEDGESLPETAERLVRELSAVQAETPRKDTGKITCALCRAAAGRGQGRQAGGASARATGLRGLNADGGAGRPKRPA